MTSEQFVKAVKLQASDAATEGTVKTLKRPPGRKPPERLLALSRWYNQLDESDRDWLRTAINEAAEMAIFEFFCVLDGVSAIEDEPNKGSLELHFLKNGESTLLNDPHQQELHNVFNRLCRDDGSPSLHTSEISPYDSGGARRMKSLLKSADDLDIHHVPDKYLSARADPNYDPNSALVIALPKSEHRQISPEEEY